MRLKARTDGPQAAIVQALRKIGCRVFDTSRCGGGFPDLVVRAVGPKCRILLMEVKSARGKMTWDQQRFLLDWPETIIVRSVEEALVEVMR